MGNPYGITLDGASLRWAAAEGVPESVIAAVRLLGEKSVDEIVARLSPAELEQVINIVGRSPSGYPPGVYATLKDKRDLAPSARADGAPLKAAPKGQTVPRNVAAEKRARPSQRPADLPQHAAGGESEPSPRSAARPPFKLPGVLVAVNTSRLSCKSVGKTPTLMPVWDSSGETQIKL